MIYGKQTSYTLDSEEVLHLLKPVKSTTATFSL